MGLWLSMRGMPILVWWRAFLGRSLRSYIILTDAEDCEGLHQSTLHRPLHYMVSEASKLFVCDIELCVNGL